jgi:NAD(P)-dependent dehydrogenase (short-subunit alcohol dehydrogenase family)
MGFQDRQKDRAMTDRRQFLLGTAAVTGAAALAGCGRKEEVVLRPPGIAISAFDKRTTAEEATAGIDLTGKTALITGGTAGLGLETLRVLSMRGAHCIVTGRTLDKAKAACATVKGPTTPVALELEDWPSLVSASNSVRAMGKPIDMLILNAGIMALPQLEKVYGIEKHFAVNHLGHFILANRLLDLVKAAPQGRVVAVSSMGYRWAPESGIEFDNLGGDRGYEPNRMYGQSKLANGLFTLELARRLAGTSTTANSVHPGVINTDLGRHFAAWKRAAAGLIGWTFMKSVEAGAATTCYVATAPALALVSGYYFEDCNPVVPVPGKHMDDVQMAQKLWDKSVELTAQYLT